MDQLTAKQVNQIGNELLSVAQTFGDYRYNNYDTLSLEDRKSLSDLHQQILQYADNMAFASAGLAVQDAAGALSKIDLITDQINKTIAKWKEVQQVINVAGSVLTLCTAFAGKDPAAVVSGLEGLVEALEALKGGADSGAGAADTAAAKGAGTAKAAVAGTGKGGAGGGGTGSSKGAGSGADKGTGTAGSGKGAGAGNGADKPAGKGAVKGGAPDGSKGKKKQ